MNDENRIKVIKKWLGTGSINIFGRPFSGKDSQARFLIEKLGGNLVGGGDVLRNSQIPENAKECIRTGKLIPSGDYANIVLPYLSQSSLAGQPLFLSSAGRWHGEEEGVIRAVNQSGHLLKAVIYLDISNDESKTRWEARVINNDRKDRHDDTLEILNTRFAEFQQKTLPVIDYYRDKGMLIEIDGKQTRGQVTNDILNTLYELAKGNN